MAFATVHDRYSAEEIARYYEQGLWQDHTLFDAVREQADAQPDKVFGTDSTTSVTFAELRDQALELALGLVRRGVGAGDRVAVQIPSWTEFFVISAALARIGAVVVPIMPIYRRDEVGYIVGAAGVKAAITTDRYRGFDHAALFLELRAECSELEAVYVVRGGTLPAGATSYDDLPVRIEGRGALASAEAEIGPGVGPDEPFVVVFSSGTTSRPKGCLHTFNTMACGARLLGRSAIRRAAAGFWIASGLLLLVLGGLYVRDGRFGAFFPALVAAALGEELIYRLAIPAVIAAALRAGNVRPTAARVAGLAGAALWFVLLPGHREQITTPAGILPFVAFAGLSAFIVFRSGSVLPLAVGHAISNLLTVLMWREAVPADARSVGLASVLGLLVLAYGQFRPITVGDDGRLLDTRTGLAVVAIDLREGHEATVQLSDGRTLPIHADFALPRHTPVLTSPEPAS
jgi:hypothetical protein